MGRDDENKRKRKQAATNYPTLTKFLKDTTKSSIAKKLEKFKKDENFECQTATENSDPSEGCTSNLYAMCINLVKSVQ